MKNERPNPSYFATVSPEWKKRIRELAQRSGIEVVYPQIIAQLDPPDKPQTSGEPTVYDQDQENSI